MSFRGRLVISLILLLIPLVASDVYFHYEQYVTNRDQAFARQMRAAQQLAASMEVFVDRTVAVHRSVGRALVVSHWHDPAARRAYVSSVLESTPTLYDMAFANPSGITVEGSPASTIGVSIADQDYFRTIKAGADWVVSDVLPSKFTGRPTFAVATAIRDNRGRLEGVVVSHVNESRLVESLHLQPTELTRLVLVDTQGRVAFAGGWPGLGPIGRHWYDYPFVRSALRGETVHVSTFGPASTPVLTGSMAPVPPIGWGAGAFIPRSVVIAPVRNAAILDALVTLAVLLLTLSIGALVARQMVRPVERLSETAEALGKGNLEARASVPNIAELATLATTMNRMAGSIRKRDQALREAYDRERRIATVLQQRMLPEVPARVGSTELAVGYFPALEEAEIGGDFYDVMLLPNGLIGLLIADVSGKGLSAAVITAMAKYMLEGFAYEDPNPASALCRLNGAVRQYSQDWKFITAFFGVLDSASGELTYANAGHLQPILRYADGTTHLLAMPSGPPLSTVADPRYRPDKIRLSEGSSLLGYTDGVVEARRDGEWFGEERLVQIVREASGSPQELVTAVHQSVLTFTDNHLSDDIALLAVMHRAPAMIESAG